MSSEYTRFGVIGRLALFTLLIVAGSFLVFLCEWGYAIISLLAIFISGWNLLYYMQNTHRKLHFFFEAVKSEDGSLHFPENVSDKNLRGLHENLNRINQLITEIRIRQAHSERFFLEFMKRSASGLIAIDDQGFVEIVNDAALKLTGLPNLTHMDRLKQHNSMLYELMEGLKPGQGESIKIPDGKELKQVAVQVAVIRFSEKEYRIFSLYDIKAELEENELETWQKLIRIMTHEIMNSIAPITSLSQTLSGFYVKKGETVKAGELQQKEIDNTVQGLNVIGERAEGLRSFVDNYRKLTRVPQPEFKPINMDHWLESIRLLFKSQEKAEQVQLEVVNTHPSKEFPGDEKLLTHVILNLLNNATEALEGTANKHIRITAETGKSGSLRLKIRDNGKGFDEEERDKIFLPFYTTREQGSGIGLSLSRQIMRLHKGSISASSVKGEWAEFVLDF